MSGRCRLRLGNDVVDLIHADSRQALASEAARRRVFAPEELRLLRRDSRPGRLLWLLWAAKESAYKVARKQDPAVAFAPKRFCVRLGNRRRRHWFGRVAFRGHEYPFVAEVQRRMIHVLALSVQREGRAVWWGLRQVGTHADLSAEVRDLARQRLSLVLGSCPSALEFVRNGRIPRLVRGGVPEPLDLTFSHHGRYVAFAAAPPDPARELS